MHYINTLTNIICTSLFFMESYQDNINDTKIKN